MKKTKIIQFVQSLVFLPVLTMMPLGSIPASAVTSLAAHIQVVAQAQIPADTTVSIDPLLVKEAAAIDAYFNKRNMPLEGTGLKMAQAADANDLDWRLLPAIAVRESTGGRNACTKVQNNPFGWGSCKIGFTSMDKAIDTLAVNLGGNNPNTARHYDGKTTTEILHTYNPPSVIPRYAEQVISIMNVIGDADLTTPPPASPVSA